MLLGEAWRTQPGSKPLAYCLSHPCSPVKPECLGSPKDSLPFLSLLLVVSPSLLRPSHVKAFLFLEGLFSHVEGLRSEGSQASACLSPPGHGLSPCPARLSACSALLPSHWTAGSLSTGLSLSCSYQTRHSPKWRPAPHPSPNCPLSSSFLEGETRGLQIVHNQLIHLPPPNSLRGLTL